MVDLIQVISALAGLRGTSISTPDAQIGFPPTETSVPYLVSALLAYFYEVHTKILS